MIGTTKSIKLTSRASVKIKDSFYTFEYCEERSIPEDVTAEELAEFKQQFWDLCNAEVDGQIEDVIKMVK